MSDSLSTPIDDQAKKDRNRKRKALLAGGLVLGIGAAATLAVFTDSEFANGTFSTGKFNIVGSANGTDFGDHNVTDGQALTFSQATTNLTPGSVVYAPFYIKTGADSLGGTLVANTPAKTGDLSTYLTATATYASYTGSETPAACGSTFGGSPAVPSLNANGANVVEACLKVEVTGTQSELQALSNPTGTIVWSWTATSA